MTCFSSISVVRTTFTGRELHVPWLLLLLHLWADVCKTSGLFNVAGGIQIAHDLERLQALSDD